MDNTSNSTTQPSAFDFHNYITNKLPTISADAATQPTSVTITPLTGGFTNVTILAAFEPPVKLAQSSSKYIGASVLSSAVLKYAPPFLATDPSQSLSVNRQKVEAQALRIFHSTDTDSGQPETIPAVIDWTKAHAGAVHIPGLILHDEEAHILWITDLGSAKTLSKWLSSLDKDGDPESVEHAAKFGKTLGDLMGSLWRDTRDPDPAVVELLKHPQADNIIDLVKGMIRNGLDEVSALDAKELSERVEESMREGGKAEPCIGMVDFWPESVLIIRSADERSGTSYQCGLIDWEYFGLTTAAAEVAMFLVHIHILHTIHAENPNVFLHLRSFTRTFIQTCVSYFSSPPSPYFQHKLLVTHGRELVNGYDLYAEEWKLSPSLKSKLVSLGLSSLRAAGPGANHKDNSGTHRHSINAYELEKAGGWMWEDLQSLLGLP
ncbi:hypothetical protein AX16_000120 [Volvariella volvacea WC 439]|nr:hypothetical protein AX16_000120 [Volvariella volvacea WC 439]